jgi:beta-mannosidase
MNFPVKQNITSVCYAQDPHTPFIYTSPLYGIGHGHSLFYNPDVRLEVFQWMAGAHKTACTGFGMPEVSPVDVLRTFIPPDELFPPRRHTARETHRATGAWHEESWLERSTLEKYFGTVTSLDDLVKYSQWLQCEGLKFIYGKACHQKPFYSMALNWRYREPWPAAANNSLIAWPNTVKPAYRHVALACRPTLASLRVPKFEWHEGDEFTCDLFMLNDTYQDLEKSRVSVPVHFDGKQETLLDRDFPGAEAFGNVQGPTARLRVPRLHSNFFTVEVRVEGKSECNSSCTLLYTGDGIQRTTPSAAYFEGCSHVQNP